MTYTLMSLSINNCICMCHALHTSTVWLYWQSDWWFPSRFEQAPLLALVYNRLAGNAAMQRRVWQGDEEHLLLGITELALTAYLAFCGFIFRSQPKYSPSHNSGLPAIRCPTRAHGETEEAPAWLLEEFPTQCKKTCLTGYEVCIAIKKF